MDDLSTKLDKIDDSKKLDYVLERAEVHTPTEACKNAEISRGTYYNWGKVEREYLNNLADALRLETALKARLILRGATKDAALVKVKGMTSKNEHVKQSAATEILDRMLGKPTQKNEVDLEVKKPVTVKHIFVHEEEEDENV